MKLTSATFGFLAIMTSLVGCASTHSEPEVGLESEAIKADTSKAPQLNLSHIECTEDGDVLAHFVLLFAGAGQPGDLTGTYNGGDLGSTPATKSSGNVWHYNVILPSGDINILSAHTTTSTGACVNLHNPGEYSGNYECGGDVVCPDDAPSTY